MMCPPKETHHKCISDDASNNTHNVCFIMQREREIHIVIYWIWYENRLLNKSKWREKKNHKNSFTSVTKPTMNESIYGKPINKIFI